VVSCSIIQTNSVQVSTLRDLQRPLTQDEGLQRHDTNMRMLLLLIPSPSLTCSSLSWLVIAV
jgi:hypothetical protein